MENPWATEFDEAPTLEFIEKDSIYEHGSFILVIPQKPCSFNTSPESGTHCVQSTHEAYNCLKVLSCKTFRRLVVDAYVYRKHCKFRGCSVMLTLQLNLHDTSTIGDEKGNTSSTIAASGCSHGRAYDHKNKALPEIARIIIYLFPFNKSKSMFYDVLFLRVFLVANLFRGRSRRMMDKQHLRTCWLQQLQPPMCLDEGTTTEGDLNSIHLKFCKL